MVRPYRWPSALALLLAFLAAPWATADGEPTVILLSWDGVRWDYPDRTELPALARLARDGVRAERLIPVFPSATFPNHVALATGTHVDRHGIVGNAFDDPELGRYVYSKEAAYIEAEPLWIAAERQGVRAASFFWVGSETDWQGRGATYRITPFDSDISESEKVDQVLAWLDLPPAERPRLILSWWHGADSVGHRYGPDHEEVTRALIEQDVQLGRLLAELDGRGAWPTTTLLLVSDHGMTASEEQIDVLGPLEAAGIGARVSRSGGFGYVHLKDVSRRDEAVELLNGIEDLQAWAADAVPERLRARFPRRTGHITIVPKAPRAIFRPRGVVETIYSGVTRAFGRKLGTHGYPPELPDMHAIFFALGRGVAPDLKLGAVRAIDVAPTVTRLLGIGPPADAEGRPIAGIGVPGPPD